MSHIFSKGDIFYELDPSVCFIFNLQISDKRQSYVQRLFRQARTYDWVRAISMVLHYLGLSLGDTSLVLEGLAIRSHEASRQWHRRGRVSSSIDANEGRSIAMDETKVKIRDQ